MAEYHVSGDAGAITFKNEAVQGVIVAGARSWGGDTINLKNDSDDQMEFIILPDDRGYGATQRGPEKNGCSINFYCRAAGAYGDWRDFWCKYVLGDRTGPTAALPSFTLVVYHKSTGKYDLYTGCKVNKGTITGSKPGALLEFSVQIYCIDFSIEAGSAPPNSFNITDIQNITVGSAPTEPTESLLFWFTNIRMQIHGLSAADYFYQKWSFSVDNHLVRVDGTKVWNDATKHRETVEIYADEREIVFEGTFKLKGADWDIAKKAGTKIDYIWLYIDDDTMRLADGDIVPSNFTERGQKSGEDSITIRIPKNNITFI